MMRKKIIISILMGLSSMLLFSSESAAQELNYKAYTLFVYNFMKYIEWPENVSKGDFVLGVMGDSRVSEELIELAKTKKAKGRTIIIKKISSAEEALNCHMVYISSSKSSTIKTLKEKVKGKPVLIVGEREGLAGRGAALSFATLDDDVLKFDINKNVIEQHSLKISSSLLALGIVVN